MTDNTALIPIHVAELRRTAATEPGSERHIVFLEDDGRRRLPIWIGAAEATVLAVILEDVQLPRPGVYQFAGALLAGAGGRLREVRITELTAPSSTPRRSWQTARASTPARATPSRSGCWPTPRST